MPAHEHPSAKVAAIGQAGAPPATDDPYTRVLELAREATSRTVFLSTVLRYLARSHASPYAALHARYASEVHQDDCHWGPTDPAFWRPSLQSFLTDSLSRGKPRAKLLTSKSGDAKVAFVSAPLAGTAGSTVGAIAFVLTAVDAETLPTRIARLEALVRFASACTENLGRGAWGGAVDAGDSAAGGGGPNAALGRVGRYTSAEELAFSITNDLRNKLACEQVALSLVVRGRIRILSISGLDDVNRRSPGVASLAGAMEECLDANEPIFYPPTGDASNDPVTSRFRLHKQWHAAAKADAVASIPLCVEESPVAILSLRSQGDRSLTRKQIDAIRSKVEPFASALVLARRAGRGVLQHTIDSCHEGVTDLLLPGRYGRKALAIASVLAAVFFFTGSTTYHLSVPCVVTVSQKRHVAAPLNGMLTAAFVLPGDRVRRGDPLCEFDRRELAQQIAQLTAELEVLEWERARAMAADSPVEAQLAEAKQHVVEARLEIARGRADRTVVRAPIDGVIVSGDLRASNDALGSVLCSRT